MNKDIGLYNKYTVIDNANGNQVDNVFVLKPLKDNNALTALKIYDVLVEGSVLAEDLLKWIQDIESKRCPYSKHKCKLDNCSLCCVYCQHKDDCPSLCDIAREDDYDSCVKFNKNTDGI